MIKAFQHDGQIFWFWHIESHICEQFLQLALRKIAILVKYHVALFGYVQFLMFLVAKQVVQFICRNILPALK